jgi:murein DD-endopeptidase MepM/ murein hydrolase activator NlpD
MNWTFMRGSALAVLASGVAACSTTPDYPTSTDKAASTPVRPAYPIKAPAVATAPPTSQSPAPVVAQAAAPVGQPQSSAPVQSEALPPAAAPATMAPASQPPRSPFAQNEPRPPAPSARQIPARYAAGGRVIAPHGMFRDYVVQRHDHLVAIARDLQTTPDAIIEANRLDTPDHLTPGQHLRIPVEKAYVAQSGDTLALVAQRFSVGAAELADLNDLSERARLKPGDQIALPANFHDRGPVEVSPAHLARVSPIYPISPAAPAPKAYAGGYDSPPRGGVYAPTGSGAVRPTVTPNYVAPAPAEPAGPALSDTQIAALAHNRFIWPVHGAIINGFGAKGLGVRNDGVDVRSAEGSTVRAAAPGEVVYAGNQIPGYGNLVLIQHADGWVTAYAHLSRTSVQMRQHVDQGQEIGLVGTSGGVSEPQLHFEVRFKASAGETARPIDPMLVLAGPATG